MATTESIQAVYTSIKNVCASPDETILPSEEGNIKNDIGAKLDAGWTSIEVVSHLKWMEYFNVEDDEYYCLDMMREVKRAVETRLAGN